MEAFNAIGTRLKSAWQREHFEETAFHELAVDALRTSDLAGQLSLRDVLDYVQTAGTLPTQADFPFGKPITVFSDPKFYIDVLTWIDGTTAIHEHGFSGAFMVLEGSSLHARYRFESSRRYNPHLHLGRTSLRELELLRVGDVRPIQAGAESAHALFHLDRPSVSLVVRTPKSHEFSVQLQYLRSGIAYNPFHEDIQAQRLIRTLEIMRELDDPAFLDRTRRLMEERDAFTAFKIADYLSRKLDFEAYRDFMTAKPHAHRELFDALIPHIHDARREANLVERRHSVKEESHRFLLALLLNLRGTADILGMVAARCPSADPVNTIMTWISELSTLPAINRDEPNAIGIELDDIAKDLMTSMLHGASDHEAIEKLRAEYEDVDELRSGLIELCSAVRESVFFGSLFA
ncbi:MAG: hypothetical protein ABI678_04945 [Kofleriaceae bacterium]